MRAMELIPDALKEIRKGRRSKELSGHAKRVREGFQSPRAGTRVVTKELEGYSLGTF